MPLGPFRPIALLLSCLALAGALACRRASDLNLTAGERTWLQAHPVLRWAPDTGYPPVEWQDRDGVIKGLAPDYLARMGQLMGVRFEPVVLPAWPQALEALRTGRVDLLSNLTDLPERRGPLRFTAPYLDVPSVLLVRAGDATRGLDGMDGRTLALERGYIVLDMVRKGHPRIRVVEVATAEEALRQVALGGADGTIADLAQASWTIEHERLPGLRMVCPLPQFPSQFSMAVRGDQATLAGILDKALAAIPPSERQALQRKWVSLQVLGWSPTPAFWGAAGAALALAGLAAALLWNVALRRRVAQRTRELEATTRSLATLNEELLQVIAEVKTLRGFIPICIRCKKIRNDGGFWDQLEAYLAAHSEARFSHGYCPDCLPLAQEEMRQEMAQLTDELSRRSGACACPSGGEGRA